MGDDQEPGLVVVLVVFWTRNILITSHSHLGNNSKTPCTFLILQHNKYSHYIKRKRIRLDCTAPWLASTEHTLRFLNCMDFSCLWGCTFISFANFAFSSSHTVNLELIIPSVFGSHSFPFTIANLKMQKWGKCRTSIWTYSVHDWLNCGATAASSEWPILVVISFKFKWRGHQAAEHNTLIYIEHRNNQKKKKL